MQENQFASAAAASASPPIAAPGSGWKFGAKPVLFLREHMSECEYESDSLCIAACGALQRDQITLPCNHLPVRWHRFDLSLIGEIPLFELIFCSHENSARARVQPVLFLWHPFLSEKNSRKYF